jgi:hypothetical protein
MANHIHISGISPSWLQCIMCFTDSAFSNSFCRKCWIPWQRWICHCLFLLTSDNALSNVSSFSIFLKNLCQNGIIWSLDAWWDIVSALWFYCFVLVYFVWRGKESFTTNVPQGGNSSVSYFFSGHFGMHCVCVCVYVCVFGICFV